MRGRRIALVALLLTACADTPNRPSPAPVAPTSGDYPALVAWFAKRDITLPTRPPPAPAAKAAQDARLRGDFASSGEVNFWDLWALWNHLTEGYEFSWYDILAGDIDGDGDTDWIDLGLLGDYLYGSGDNPHGIGQPLVEPDTFDIELEYVGYFSTRYKQIFELAADRWEAVIAEGLPSITVDMNTEEDLSWWATHSQMPHMHVQDTIDDLRIYVGWGHLERGVWGWAGGFWFTVEDGKLDRPILGRILLDRDELEGQQEMDIQSLFAHEIGHVLGIGGPKWDDLLQDPSPYQDLIYLVDTYFPGLNAVAAFNQVGGQGYRGGARVPVENGLGGMAPPSARNAHWRDYVFGEELMASRFTIGEPQALSIVTVQALADLGYTVDLSQADPYTLPVAGKPVATAGRVFCGGVHMPPGAPTN